MTLQEKLIRLSEIKETSMTLEKEVKKLSSEIKEEMIKNNLKSLSHNNFKAELQETQSVKFDQEAFIKYSKQKGYDKSFNLLKVVEVLNEEQLEMAVYNGYIPQVEVDQFKTVDVNYRFVAKELK